HGHYAVSPLLLAPPPPVGNQRWLSLPQSPIDARTGKHSHALPVEIKFCQQLVREIQIAYFFGSLLSASFSAVFSASAAFTFTSGSTPVPSQLVFEMGLTTLMPGTRIVKWSSIR